MSVLKTSEKRKIRRNRRHLRVRKKVKGTPERPRLCVFRSLSHIYAQIIDDTSGRVLVSSSSLALKNFKGKKSEVSKEVGKSIALKAKEKGIENVVFDRGGYIYHGRVKALAEGAKENGLKF